jgi:hypothetical protein
MYVCPAAADLCNSFEAEHIEHERLASIQPPNRVVPMAIVANSDGPKFPQRAAWLTERLRERGWDHNTLEKFNGPDHKTTLKVLAGEKTIRKVIGKIVSGLNSHRSARRVSVDEIPDN